MLVYVHVNRSRSFERGGLVKVLAGTGY
jgi:hypothetical protein